MAVDIGVEAIERSTFVAALYTYVVADHPAEIGGVITSIDIYPIFGEDIEGLIVGTFYTTNGNTLKCRDSEAIAGIIPADEKTTKPVSITVEIGDYIGCYFTSGRLAKATSGYNGFWPKLGEYIDPGDEAEYIPDPAFDDTLSLGGYIGVVGWTGKISGVTNPAKIMGVAVANIAKVKGVVSS